MRNSNSNFPPRTIVSDRTLPSTLSFSPGAPRGKDKNPGCYHFSRILLYFIVKLKKSNAMKFYNSVVALYENMNVLPNFMSVVYNPK